MILPSKRLNDSARSEIFDLAFKLSGTAGTERLAKLCRLIEDHNHIITAEELANLASLVGKYCGYEYRTYMAFLEHLPGGSYFYHIHHIRRDSFLRHLHGNFPESMLLREMRLRKKIASAYWFTTKIYNDHHITEHDAQLNKTMKSISAFALTATPKVGFYEQEGTFYFKNEEDWFLAKVAYSESITI